MQVHEITIDRIELMLKYKKLEDNINYDKLKWNSQSLIYLYNHSKITYNDKIYILKNPNLSSLDFVVGVLDEI